MLAADAAAALLRGNSGDPGKGRGEDLEGQVKPPRESALHSDAVGGAWARAALHLVLQVESVRGHHLGWLSEKPTLTV